MGSEPHDVRKTKAYLFVYGTLRRDTNSEMFQLLARQADFVGGANYQGKLYKIDDYPGVVASKNNLSSG